VRHDRCEARGESHCTDGDDAQRKFLDLPVQSCKIWAGAALDRGKSPLILVVVGVGGLLCPLGGLAVTLATHCTARGSRRSGRVLQVTKI
jgi:hypothetical protein